jgi:hypothetical protein
VCPRPWVSVLVMLSALSAQMLAVCCSEPVDTQEHTSANSNRVKTFKLASINMMDGCQGDLGRCFLLLSSCKVRTVSRRLGVLPPCLPSSACCSLFACSPLSST